MKKRLTKIPLKKFLIFVMVACFLTLGGLMITGPMLDNSDPITSGEYTMSDPIPIPEVKPEDPGPGGDTVEKLEKIANSTIDKGKELISEVSKEFGDTEKNKNAAKKGGFGLGTLFVLYMGYRFIFK